MDWFNDATFQLYSLRGSTVQCFYQLLAVANGVVCSMLFQMENIQTFLTFCEHYGVPKGNLFQTVDLYEGANMAQMLSCIQCLGSEVNKVRIFT